MQISNYDINDVTRDSPAFLHGKYEESSRFEFSKNYFVYSDLKLSIYNRDKAGGLIDLVLDNIALIIFHIRSIGLDINITDL